MKQSDLCLDLIIQCKTCEKLFDCWLVDPFVRGCFEDTPICQYREGIDEMVWFEVTGEGAITGSFKVQKQKQTRKQEEMSSTSWHRNEQVETGSDDVGQG